MPRKTKKPSSSKAGLAVRRGSAAREGRKSEALPFPIAGIGASAGGLEALARLLRAMPVDTGVGFVVVQHLSPSHESMLAEILSRSTTMPVIEVGDEPLVEPDCVYVIPPDRQMTISEGRLRLRPRDKAGSHRLVDQFLRSLAADRGARAIGVILSGTGGDGSLGVEEVKGAGGITFAQDATAQQRGMPASAIATGCIDFVLPPEGIAAEVSRLVRSPYLDSEPASVHPEDSAEFTKIVHLLRDDTGIDFTHYRSSTLFRRITRRMALQKIDVASDYTRLLQESADERSALYHDILINVTSFFRDPDMFQALVDQVLPRTFSKRSAHEPVRVWVIGCSTGEEAYSVAIVFQEFAERNGIAVPIQVFATDLNDRAIAKARLGVYAKDIEQDVSPERLRRYFSEVDGHYRVSKTIRDMCIFARHNLLADPPFSRMDLVTCRNLLIYIDPVLQQKIIPIFHYALKPRGALVLGGSETIGSHRDLFDTDDARQRIFRRKDGATRLAFGAGAPAEGGGPRAETRANDAVHGADMQREAERVLLMRYAPAGVIVNAELEIVHVHGDTGAYLSPARGRASLNLTKMAREGLQVAMRSAIQQAKSQGGTVRREGVQVRASEGMREINVEVTPLRGDATRSGGFLITFQEPLPALGFEAEPSPTVSPAAGHVEAGETSEHTIARIAQELLATREYLQSVIEQHEAANEELQSANEEAQSANEEMQSINEELETSKEEIQSSNEELATVNDELSHRNTELGQLSNDVLNLLGSVRIPIVMLGMDLRIRRFTSMAERVLNLIPTDIGRPLGDLKMAAAVPQLDALLEQVIANAVEKDVEVQDDSGHWYSMRFRPYRTLENKVEGAVVMWIDIDEVRRARELAESIVATVREPLIVLDENLCVQSASRSFYQMFRVDPVDVAGRPFYDLGRGHWRIPQLQRLLDEVLPKANAFDDFKIDQEFDGIGRKTILLNGRRLLRASGETPYILLAIEDVTARTRLFEAEQDARQAAEDASAAKDQFLATVSHELRNPMTSILGWSQLAALAGYEPATMRKAIETIEASARTQARVIDDMLDTSRMLTGRFEFNMKPLDLSEVVAAAVSAAVPAASAKGVTIETALASATIEGDQQRLLQVFNNLLSNAIKFSTPNTQIAVTSELANEHVAVSVADEGQGIAPEFLPYVFDRYQQYHKGAFGGLGLGLAIANHLVKGHGGTLVAESAGVGKGATFRVVLPVIEG